MMSAASAASAAASPPSTGRVYSQYWKRWDLRRDEPMEGRLENLLQGAAKLKEVGNALYQRKELQKAQSAYADASSVLLIPATGDFFSPHYREQFQALASTLYANKAAVYLELGELEDAEQSCSLSLILKESPKVYLRRGKIQEKLGCPEIALCDYRTAARLEDDSTKAQEAHSRAAKVAAELGSDSGGNTRYTWQKKWAAGGVPELMEEVMEALLRPEARGRHHRGWGELRAHPGPDSDIRWEDLSSATDDTKDEFFRRCYAAIAMLFFGGPHGSEWQDLSCAYAWGRELWGRGFRLDPMVATSLGSCMIHCRGFPLEDAEKGFTLLTELAEGRHNYLTKVAPEHLQSDDCVLGWDEVRSLRSSAIENLLCTQEAFKFGCVSLPRLLDPNWLKALYRTGSKELNHNKIQQRYATTFFRGDVWPTDIRKHVRWLEKAAANPYPEPNAKAMVELAGALSTGSSDVRQDLDRAEGLARAAVSIAAPGSEEWASGQRLLMHLDDSKRGCSQLFSRQMSQMTSEEEAKRVRKCSHCGKAPSDVASKEAQSSIKLKECARCQLVSYCSRECQAAAWPEHKKVCAKV